MNELRTLLEEFWVTRDGDREKYYRVKREVPAFQKFVREQLGWKLIHTENLIKLEKVPAHAESFMGIREFAEIRDYAILCAVLMFLEDREEQERFLLSELIDYVETILKESIQIDWTSFTQRKSLVRVLQYLEGLQILRVHEGTSEAFGQERGREVLYENTGYSRYFAVSFGRDISQCQSWQDFEKAAFEEFSEDRGVRRINRVYRQLAACPALYWENPDDADAYYLKNQRQWVAKNLGGHLGGRLDIHKNAAFWMLEDREVFGEVHPRDAMLPEAVLLLCSRLQELVAAGELEKGPDECLRMERGELKRRILELRDTWNSAWSKEFREMDEERLVERMLQYMKQWMMLREEDGQAIVLPAAGKLGGYYPADFAGGEKQ